MKSSSELIAEQVFSVNAFYNKKQNETKILFFKCLMEKKSVEYFENELSKIWDNVDHKFMDKQIYKLKELVHSNNVNEALNLGRFDSEFVETMNWVIDDEYFRLTPEEDFTKFERRFKQYVEKQYRSSLNTGGLDEETYLLKKLNSYDKNVNQIITYFDSLGNPVRQVQLATYLAMIHNTNLTRSGWNQTMSDSEKLGKASFIIPPHSFSCPHCLEYQNRVLTKYEVENIIGVEAIEQQGDILHPNCKCELDIYWDKSQIQKLQFTYDESVEIYKLRQKANRLTLEKENRRADRTIAKMFGNEETVDKCTQRINGINQKLREIKEQLPTEELRKQVTAIKR